MTKIKIIRDYSGLELGKVYEVETKVAEFLIQNQVAKKSDCGGDCDECEDCKGKNKKKAPAKKKETKTKKKPTARKK